MAPRRSAPGTRTRAQVEIVPGAPHAMYWETPALCNDALGRFLDGSYATQAARA